MFSPFERGTLGPCQCGSAHCVGTCRVVLSHVGRRESQREVWAPVWKRAYGSTVGQESTLVDDALGFRPHALAQTRSRITKNQLGVLSAMILSHKNPAGHCLDRRSISDTVSFHSKCNHIQSCFTCYVFTWLGSTYLPYPTCTP